MSSSAPIHEDIQKSTMLEFYEFSLQPIYSVHYMFRI